MDKIVTRLDSLEEKIENILHAVENKTSKPSRVAISQHSSDSADDQCFPEKQLSEHRMEIYGDHNSVDFDSNEAESNDFDSDLKNFEFLPSNPFKTDLLFPHHRNDETSAFDLFQFRENQ